MNKKYVLILTIALAIGLGLFIFAQVNNDSENNTSETSVYRNEEENFSSLQTEQRKQSVEEEVVVENEESSSNVEGNEEVSEESVVVYFFWGDGCPHCAVQKPFLEEMEQKYPELEVKMYETWKNRDNLDLFQEMAEAYGIRARGVPTTFIGDLEPIVGFTESMESSMENTIKTCIEQGCIDPGSKL